MSFVVAVKFYFSGPPNLGNSGTADDSDHGNGDHDNNENDGNDNDDLQSPCPQFSPEDMQNGYHEFTNILDNGKIIFYLSMQLINCLLLL